LTQKAFAKNHRPESETRVLVVGMPNVGKSSILNALRSMGMSGSNWFLLIQRVLILMPDQRNAKSIADFGIPWEDSSSLYKIETFEQSKDLRL
jgi:50S ribosome-binding GTPase